MKKLFLVLVMLVFAVECFSADTWYIDADATGAANGTSWTDAFTTFAAANSASSSGDTLYFSGGSYAGLTGAMSRSLLIEGSTETGHDDQVTIYYTGLSGYTVGFNGADSTIRNIKVTHSPDENYSNAISVLKANCIIDGVDLESVSGALVIKSGGTSSIIRNILFDRSVLNTGSNNDTAIDAKPTSTINYCLFTGPGNGHTRVADTGATVTMNNCTSVGNSTIQNTSIKEGVLNVSNTVFAAMGLLTYTGALHLGLSGTLNTNNCFIQGSTMRPHYFVNMSGTATWNSTDDIFNEFPYFTKTRSNNIGYFSFNVDDGDIDYFKEMADYAMSTYGIPLVFYVSTKSGIDVENDPTAQEKLRDLYADGHEIGAHTRHHSDLSYTDALTIDYAGAGTAEVTVNSEGTNMVIVGEGVSESWDFSDTDYDTLGEIQVEMNALAGFTCAMLNAYISRELLPSALKSTTVSIPTGTSEDYPFDDDTSANNRFYKEEITNCISDLEDAIGGSYTAMSFAYPLNASGEFARTWIATHHPNIISSRVTPNFTSQYAGADLRSLDVLQVSAGIDLFELRGVGTAGDGDNYITQGAYDALSDANKQARIEQAARVIATGVSEGYFYHVLTHGATDFSVDEFKYLIDEIQKYRTYFEFTTILNGVNSIRGSGLWVNSTGTTWTRTFGYDGEYSPLSNSPLIGAGSHVSGLDKDFDGKTIAPYDAANIGAYHSVDRPDQGTIIYGNIE